MDVTSVLISVTITFEEKDLKMNCGRSGVLILFSSVHVPIDHNISRLAKAEKDKFKR